MLETRAHSTATGRRDRVSPPARFDMRRDRFAAASGSGASPPRRGRPYGRAIVMTGDVQVSQCAGLLSSPSALSTEIFTT